MQDDLTNSRNAGHYGKQPMMSNAPRKSLLERSLHWNPGLVWLVLGLAGATCSTAAVYVLWLIFELIRNPLA